MANPQAKKATKEGTRGTKGSNLWTRTVSGAVLVALVLWLSDASVWSFFTLWTLIGIACLWEYWSLLHQHRSTSTVNRNKSWYYTLGTAYIVLGLTALMSLPADMVITLLLVVWLCDSGAYLVGITIGKHKMAPKISPKKSWEGFFGGLLFGVATALILYALYWKFDPEPLRATFGETAADKSLLLKIKWLGFGLFASLAAVGGDLIESFFKRTIGVKDSGNLIPGHGGMLDRFDALLLAAPVIWCYVRLAGLI